MTRRANDVSTELDAAILELAEDLRSTGTMDEATYEKITIRQLGKLEATTTPLTGDEIRALREQAKMSQAVFAHHLKLTPGYVSQLERGAKLPSGPALVLLNVIRRHGMEAVLT